MRFEKIPPLFWSDLTNKPFNSCINCKKEIVQSGEMYLIEKAVKGFKEGKISSTVFEYAMCMSCAQELRGELSQSSKENIEAFYTEHVDFQKRSEELKDAEDAAWLQNCLIDKEPVTEQGECQLFGLCQGEYMMYQEFPYMIRGEAMDKVVDLISQETLDELDRFKDDLISGPPELRELFEKAGPRVLI